MAVESLPTAIFFNYKIIHYIKNDPLTDDPALIKGLEMPDQGWSRHFGRTTMIPQFLTEWQEHDEQFPTSGSVKSIVNGKINRFDDLTIT